MAFFPRGLCGTMPHMARKYPSYIKEWRKAARLTQQQVCDRLVTMAGDPKPKDEALAIPTTTTSLSRIENGSQNWNAATLFALAEILGADPPGELLTRNPSKEGKVVPFRLERLTPAEQEQANAVLEAMFGRAL